MMMDLIEIISSLDIVSGCDIVSGQKFQEFYLKNPVQLKLNS
jgi:hypothetical protein